MRFTFTIVRKNFALDKYVCFRVFEFQSEDPLSLYQKVVIGMTSMDFIGLLVELLLGYFKTNKCSFYIDLGVRRSHSWLFESDVLVQLLLEYLNLIIIFAKYILELEEHCLKRKQKLKLLRTLL